MQTASTVHSTLLLFCRVWKTTPIWHRHCTSTACWWAVSLLSAVLGQSYRNK